MAITELETLKDINFYKELGKFTSNDKIKELLKSKAIKWIKHFKEKEKGIFDNMAFARMEARIDCLMGIYNITEEELQ